MQRRIVMLVRVDREVETHSKASLRKSWRRVLPLVALFLLGAWLLTGGLSGASAGTLAFARAGTTAWGDVPPGVEARGGGEKALALPPPACQAWETTSGPSPS